MAPSNELAKAEEGLSKEALESALAGRDEAELQEMARRLRKSQQQFQEMLEELEADQQALREENTHLHDTISSMMQELRKLNIGSDNTVEPMLDEGPFDFVGRMWEKVKPRDTAWVVSEHVGEIRKPVPAQEGSLQQQISEELGKQSSQVIQRLSSRFGPFWQRAEGLVSDARGEIAKRIAEHTKQPVDCEDMAQAEPRDAKPKKVGRSAGTAAATPDEEASQADVAPPEPAQPAEQTEAVPQPGLEQSPEQTEEQISSTILIEAQIKIDDGSTQTLHVRAADRCKEVAERFVQEHSLKAWFKAPLTVWLKKVEADAVKFPVQVEADLMEIRKLYSKVGK